MNRYIKKKMRVLLRELFLIFERLMSTHPLHAEAAFTPLWLIGQRLTRMDVYIIFTSSLYLFQSTGQNKEAF